MWVGCYRQNQMITTDKEEGMKMDDPNMRCLQLTLILQLTFHPGILKYSKISTIWPLEASAFLVPQAVASQAASLLQFVVSPYAAQQSPTGMVMSHTLLHYLKCINWNIGLLQTCSVIITRLFSYVGINLSKDHWWYLYWYQNQRISHFHHETDARKWMFNFYQSLQYDKGSFCNNDMTFLYFF